MEEKFVFVRSVVNRSSTCSVATVSVHILTHYFFP